MKTSIKTYTSELTALLVGTASIVGIVAASAIRQGPIPGATELITTFSVTAATVYAVLRLTDVDLS
ncbi:MAG: hypothetical protein J07HR59_00232 [Halorubrum sp. J07HR59]|nr:MAG: hypothetical protein J07HR59_00232 [Halorubrum sp. J07HR59]